MLSLLGKQPLWSPAEIKRFDRGSAPVTDPEDAMVFEKMIADFDAAQPLILAGLDEIIPERLAEPAPFSPANNPKETVGTLLAGLVFHEAYHVGQASLLRRLLGLEAIFK
jgi:hypothetical protein